MMTGPGIRWSPKLVINAWDDRAVAPAKLGPKALGWALRSRLVGEKLMFPAPPDYRDWRDPRVGWGLVLPHRPGASEAELATDEDAPQPIRDLRAARSTQLGPAPIFRYDPASEHNRTHLRNSISKKSVYLARTAIGVAGDQMPFYLLIYGAPDEVPWHLQYTLNASRAVGRLPLKGEGLRRYVDACLSDWVESPSQVLQTVVSATYTDYMSRLMRDSVAARVSTIFAHDPKLGPGTVFLDGKVGKATHAELVEALVARRPALVVTTSHGQTGPLSDPSRMAAHLGLPVDQDGTALQLDDLTDWNPGGAIWYALACCSAGSDGQSQFDDLVEMGSPVALTLQGVAALGSRVAPLPQALLGAEAPLRAFIGHVEPTFDWTLKQASGQHLTAPTVQALTDGLYSGEPVGLAFRRCYDQLAGLNALHLQQKGQIPNNPSAKAEVIYLELTGRDLQSMVLFGDPAVKLHP